MTAKIKKKPRIDWKTVKLSPDQQLRAVSLIKLGHFILSKYSLPSWVTVDDRTDIVNLAVVKCSATFDASKQIKQSTWLSWYIMSCVREFTNPRLVGDIQRLKERLCKIGCWNGSYSSGWLSPAGRLEPVRTRSSASSVSNNLSMSTPGRRAVTPSGGATGHPAKLVDGRPELTGLGTRSRCR